MLNHGDVWGAIDQLAARNGLSASALARSAGLDPTTFNKSKRVAPDGRPRWPSTESIAKVLTATQSTVFDLFCHSSMPGCAPTGVNIPVIGKAYAGTLDAASVGDSPSPARIVRFPDQRYDPMYALNVVGDSMLPLYRDGDALFVTTALEPSAGDRVVMKRKDGVILVKILQRFDGETYELLALSPEHDNTIVRHADVEFLAKIVYATQ